MTAHDLRRMIEAAGGQVVFDLPPPDVGRKSGDLTGRIDWFVDDEREPLVQNERRETTATGNEMEAFLKTRSDTIRELHQRRPAQAARSAPVGSSAMTTPPRSPVRGGRRQGCPETAHEAEEWRPPRTSPPSLLRPPPPPKSNRRSMTRAADFARRPSRPAFIKAPGTFIVPGGLLISNATRRRARRPDTSVGSPAAAAARSERRPSGETSRKLS